MCVYNHRNFSRECYEHHDQSEGAIPTQIESSRNNTFSFYSSSKRNVTSIKAINILSVFRLKSKCEGPQPLRISSASSVIRQHFTTMQPISHGARSSQRFIDGIRLML